MNIELNGEIYLNGYNIITSMLDLTSLSDRIDYSNMILIVVACLLGIDLFRRIMSSIFQHYRRY